MNNMYDSDTQDALSQMHPELILANIRRQIKAGLESPYTVNYLKEYLYQYKYYKNMYDGESDILSSLRDSLDKTLEMVIEEISDKYNFRIDISTGYSLKKIAKALYNFFVVKYDKFLIEFITNNIRINSKEYIDIIKANREKPKGKTVSLTSAKMLYANKSPIMLNVNYILTNIIPSLDLSDEEFFENFDSGNMTIDVLKDLFTGDDMIASCDNLFEEFYEPIADKAIGCDSIISEVKVDLSNIYMVNKLYDEITMIEEEENNE